jgi:glycosyltransferase involved in cell wall biosynthesis
MVGQNAPLISIMTTVYNGAPYLAEAIESVLGQTYRPVELIVVDDGSDDGSREIAEAYVPPLRYVYHARRGMGASRNRAAELANGQYLAYLDADDRLTPNALEKEAAALAAHPEVDVVFGHVREFVSPELDATARAGLRPASERLPGRLPTTMLIRRDAFFRVGLFATDLKMGVGMDWSARAIEAGLKSLMLPDVLFERRLHGQNNGIRERERRTDYVRAVKAALDRRRTEGAHRAGATTKAVQRGDERSVDHR